MLRKSRAWLSANVDEGDMDLVATQLMVRYREHRLYGDKVKEDRQKQPDQRHRGKTYTSPFEQDGDARPFRRLHNPPAGAEGAHAFRSCITCCSCAGKVFSDFCVECRKKNPDKSRCHFYDGKELRSLGELVQEEVARMWQSVAAAQEEAGGQGPPHEEES